MHERLKMINIQTWFTNNLYYGNSIYRASTQTQVLKTQVENLYLLEYWYWYWSSI